MSRALLPLALAVGACASEPPREVAPPPRAQAPEATPPQRPAPMAAAPFHVEPTWELTGGRAQDRHNILVISLDTVSAPHLAAWGGRAETPTLDALAARGARFSHAYTHFPETCLSHWAMVTGVPPEAHGNAPAARGSIYSGPTLFEIADQEGYATAGFVGGVTLTDASCGFGRGFAEYDDRFPFRPDDMRRAGAEVTQRAVGWINRQEGPWAAFVHYFDAHFPYTPGPPWDRRYDPDYEGVLTGSDADLRPFRDGGQTPSPAELNHVAALYEGEISELDALLRPLLDAAGTGTVVVVTADHGESFGHGYWFNHRDALTEDVLRVPLVIAGPGVAPATTVDDVVGLQDLAPTVLTFAGLPTDTRMVGRSLATAVAGGTLAAQPVFARTDPFRGVSRRAVVGPGGHKLVDPGDRPPERFDLRRDPTEQAPSPLAPPEFSDAWASHAAAVAALAPWQVPPPQPMGHSEEEAHQLELLGYREGHAPPQPGPPRSP